MEVLEVEEATPVVAGLLGAIDVDGGPSEEQRTVLSAIVSHLLPRSDLDLDNLTPAHPQDVSRALVRPEGRLRFCEMLMTLELCRHPQSANRWRGSRSTWP